MRYKLSLILFCLLIGFTNVAFSGIGDWHNYTYSNNGQAIASFGKVIVCGTSGGLIRFNSATGEIKKFLNSEGLGDVNIKSVEFDQDGNLFIGGSNGNLTKMNTAGAFSIYPFRYSGEIRYNLNGLAADGETLWVATDIGVARFLINRNGGEFQDIASRLGEIPRETAVRAVCVVGDYVWAGTDSGLAFIYTANNLPQDPQSWVSYRRNQSGLTNARIYSVAEMEGNIYAGSADGVFAFQTDSTWVNIGLQGLVIFDLASKSDTLYAATNLGIYRYYGSNWEMLPNDSLLSSRVRGIAFDDQGNLWAAFDGGGFAMQAGLFWITYQVPGPAANTIYDIAIDSSNNIWMTHFSAGVSKFDGVNWQIFNAANSGLRPNGAYCIEYDRIHSLLWIGSWGDGLFSFDGQYWVNFDNTNSPFQGVSGAPGYVAVTDVTFDYQGNVWALNLDGVSPVPGGPILVMAAHNPADSVWQPYYENSQQIPDNGVFELLSSGNDIYVGGRAGVFHLDRGNDAFSTNDDTWHGLIISAVGAFAMAFVENEGLFAGGSFGLVYYSFAFDDTLVIDLPDGYRSTVYSLERDGLGNIWVGCDSGVVVMPKNFNRNNPNWIFTFKTTNSPLLSNAVRHIEIDPGSGFVYIGTDGGLSVFESGFARPSLDLNDIAIYPNPINVRMGQTHAAFLRVPAEAQISIYSVAGDLVKRFEYGGSNSYWDLTNEAGLPVSAGVYIIHVKAENNSGITKVAVIR